MSCTFCRYCAWLSIYLRYWDAFFSAKTTLHGDFLCVLSFSCPSSNETQTFRYGSVGSAMLTLFQVSTCVWSDTAYASWHGCNNYQKNPGYEITNPMKLQTPYGSFLGFRCAITTSFLKSDVFSFVTNKSDSNVRWSQRYSVSV